MKDIKDLKFNKECLIKIDMVNEFGREEAYERIKEILRSVKFIKQAMLEEKSDNFIKEDQDENTIEFERFGGIHCVKESNETELVDELKQYEDKYTNEKNFTSFMETPIFRKFIENFPEVVEYTEAYPYFREIEVNITGKEKKIGERK